MRNGAGGNPKASWSRLPSVLFAVVLVISVVSIILAQEPIGGHESRKAGSNDPQIIVASSTKDPPTVSAVDLAISLESAPAMGDERASVAIVEFADYQCPFCLIHANQSLPQIVENYVQTGKIRYFFKDIPIQVMHPQAFKQAEAAHCAGDQGKFWDMHNRLLKDPRPQVLNELSAYAAALNLDVARFQRCVQAGTHAFRVRQSIAEAQRYGVQGTPTFFVGTLHAEELAMNARTRIFGAQPYATFQKVLDQALSSEGGEHK